MMTNAGNTKHSPPRRPPHHPPRAYARKIPSCVAVAPGTMLATASPSRNRSLDTHRRRCCSSACMMPMIAGPPYEVAPRRSSVLAMSFESPGRVVSGVSVVMGSLLRGERKRAEAVGILTFVSGKGRQDDSEERAMSGLALDLDATAVRLDCPARDGETEAGPARVAR